MPAPLRGDIVLAVFPFADLRGKKRRPACVVSVDAFHRGPDVILAMLTSSATKLTTPGFGDVVLTGWQAAGLLAPSAVRAGRLLVIGNRCWARPSGAYRKTICWRLTTR